MTFTESQEECKVLEGKDPACLVPNEFLAPNISISIQKTLSICFRKERHDPEPIL